MLARPSDRELLEHVKGALLASYNAVKGKGSEANVKVNTSVDIRTVGDLTSNEALVKYFRDSGLPLVLYTEELEKPKYFSENPLYAAIADDVDGTRNMNYGFGMLPHGSIVGIAANPNPRFDDIVAAGFLEFNSGNLFYAMKGGGARLIGRWVHGDEQASREIHTSGVISLENVGSIVPDSYMLGSLAPFFALDASKGGGDYHSTGVHLALLASGSIDLFIFADNCMNLNKLRTGEEAGPLYLLLKEAGGTILDWKGNDLGPEKIGIDKKKTFHGVAAATEQLGKAYIRERMMKTSQLADYIAKLHG